MISLQNDVAKCTAYNVLIALWHMFSRKILFVEGTHLIFNT